MEMYHKDKEPILTYVKASRTSDIMIIKYLYCRSVL